MLYYPDTSPTTKTQHKAATQQQEKRKMVERVKKFTDGILKNSLEITKKSDEERVTIVLASYQEGQVIQIVKIRKLIFYY